ncbi:phosphatase domain-containing protein [uncultured Propionibacterium sp.]|uniref:App1 family protein n=1 Tax=uncultured Propionibacterium sp. TaxID=218066 RepID=UPI002930C971|nr:phosphatase domain-containing protein [uncultured Propionibacterium sp.]
MRHGPAIGIRVNDFVTRRVGAVLRRRGWREKPVPFIGYGTPDGVRVLGRLVLRPDDEKLLPAHAGAWLRRRGWRNFLELPAPHRPVRLTVAGRTRTLRTDRRGYVDTTVGSGLEPGWHTVRLAAADGTEAEVPVQIVGPDERFGMISDIDDTIISTWMPRLFLAVWNSFFQLEGNRQAVPGMARMYQRLLAEHPGAPIFYVSTGAWTSIHFLKRFMARHGFPRGALLLTDWGPTPTAWVRSGTDHKRNAMAELAGEFPGIRWVLVGDDGQHDPELYREFAQKHPDRVRAVVLRSLSPTEQVLAHGTATLLAGSRRAWLPRGVPSLHGADGDALWPALADALGLRAERPPKTRGRSGRQAMRRPGSLAESRTDTACWEGSPTTAGGPA